MMMLSKLLVGGGAVSILLSLAMYFDHDNEVATMFVAFLSMGCSMLNIILKMAMNG